MTTVHIAARKICALLPLTCSMGHATELSIVRFQGASDLCFVAPWIASTMLALFNELLRILTRYHTCDAVLDISWFFSKKE